MDLRTLLRKKFRVGVPIYYRPPIVVTHLDSTGRSKPVFSAYARISHQIYNTTDDYLKFHDADN